MKPISKEANANKSTGNNQQSKELETQQPLSEKDEVKKAETRLQQLQKNKRK